MVVEYSVSGYVPGYTHTHKSSIVEVKIFNVVLFENDDAGDANTKVIIMCIIIVIIIIVRIIDYYGWIGACWW